MRQEFHGNGTYTFKLLYGWGTINASVWLPSLCELVGYTGTQHATWGTYNSAMKGLSTSSNYHVMEQGGTQFAYFAQYNAAGGPEKLWACGGSHPYWLRSPDYAQTQHVTSTLENGNVSTYVLVTRSYAVHPAVVYIRKNTEKTAVHIVPPRGYSSKRQIIFALLYWLHA